MRTAQQTDPTIFQNGPRPRPKTAQNGPTTKPQVTALKTAAQNRHKETDQNIVKAAQTGPLYRGR